MKAKVTAAVLFVCSAINIVWLVPGLPRDNRIASLAVLACALGFLAASCAIFLGPRLSYFVGTISGIVALHWFSRIEFLGFSSAKFMDSIESAGRQSCHLHCKAENPFRRYDCDLNRVVPDTSAASQLDPEENPHPGTNMTRLRRLFRCHYFLVPRVGEAVSYSLDRGCCLAGVGDIARRKEWHSPS
jgi:hypothetical protein